MGRTEDHEDGLLNVCSGTELNGRGVRGGQRPEFLLKAVHFGSTMTGGPLGSL